MEQQTSQKLYSKPDLYGPDFLQISPRKFDLMVAAGEFPAPIRIGRLCRWTQAQIDQFLKALNDRTDSPTNPSTAAQRPNKRRPGRPRSSREGV